MIGLTHPELKGKINGCAGHAPALDASLKDGTIAGMTVEWPDLSLNERSDDASMS
jgi:hypothetical protein